MVLSYLQKLIEELTKRTEQELDLVRWFDFTTFDVIGDLSFGEPFDCLTTSVYHPWVETLLQVVVAVSFIHAAQLYPPFDKILMSLAPKKALEIRDNHTNMSNEKVNRRLEAGIKRPDFWSHILRHNDEKGMSLPEMQVNAATLIIAGSETISTTCSGATYYLCKNPAFKEQLFDEIRGSFESEAQITMASVAPLRLLHATLTEGMRLFPPAPAGAPRMTPPEGETIGGHFVPGGVSSLSTFLLLRYTSLTLLQTTVMVSQLAAYTHPANFTDPLKWDPTRWLENPAYDKDVKDVYQPFSVGPRNCIGRNLAWAETKLIMAKMIWNFDFDLLDDNFEPQRQKMHVLWQKPQLRVKLHRRAF